MNKGALVIDLAKRRKGVPGKGGASAMTVADWNAANPTHPRDAAGRFRDVLGGLSTEQATAVRDVLGALVGEHGGRRSSLGKALLDALGEQGSAPATGGSTVKLPRGKPKASRPKDDLMQVMKRSTDPKELEAAAKEWEAAGHGFNSWSGGYGKDFDRWAKDNKKAAGALEAGDIAGRISQMDSEQEIIDALGAYEGETLARVADALDIGVHSDLRRYDEGMRKHIARSLGAFGGRLGGGPKPKLTQRAGKQMADVRHAHGRSIRAMMDKPESGDRERLHGVLMGMTVKDMQTLVSELNAERGGKSPFELHGARKADKVNNLVGALVGSKLDSSAIRGGHFEGDKYVPGRAGWTAENKQTFTDPRLPNTWGGFPEEGKSHFHGDGAIPSAVESMGSARQIGFEGTTLARTLDKLATDATLQRITPAEQLAELKRIRAEVNNREAELWLDVAIGKLSPKSGVDFVSELPAGSPDVLVRLMRKLEANPMLSNDNMASNAERSASVRRAIVNVAEGYLAGRNPKLRGDDLWRATDFHHESMEGYAALRSDIDEAAKEFVTLPKYDPSAGFSVPGPKAADVDNALRGMTSEAEATAHLRSLGLDREGLRSLAEQLGVVVGARYSKEEIMEKIVDLKVSWRKTSKAIEGTSEAPVSALTFGGQVRAKLKSVASEAEAWDYLESLKLTGPQMKELARELDIAGRTKTEIANALVKVFVQGRLTTAAVKF